MPNGRAAHPNSLELKALIKHPSHDKWKRMEGQGSEGKEKVSSSSERGNKRAANDEERMTRRVEGRKIGTGTGRGEGKEGKERKGKERKRKMA